MTKMDKVVVLEPVYPSHRYQSFQSQYFALQPVYYLIHYAHIHASTQSCSTPYAAVPSKSLGNEYLRPPLHVLTCPYTLSFLFYFQSHYTSYQFAHTSEVTSHVIHATTDLGVKTSRQFFLPPGCASAYIYPCSCFWFFHEI